MITSDPEADFKLMNVTPHTLVFNGQSRLLFWTGRVAIGLRYERQVDPERSAAQQSESMKWLQDICLSTDRPLTAMPPPPRLFPNWKHWWVDAAIALLLLYLMLHAAFW